MAKQRPTPDRKTRTREHVIAALAYNHVERQVLLCGYTMERLVHDYGLDASVFVYTAAGEPESGAIFVQVKGTEQITRLQDGQTLAFRVERSHVRAWLEEAYPVILTLYEMATHTAYWVYVQRHFESLPDFDLFRAGETITIHLPATQVVSPAAIAEFAQALSEVRQQLKGKVRHV